MVQIKKILKETDAPCLHTWQSTGTRQEQPYQPMALVRDGLPRPPPPATQSSSLIKSSSNISLVFFMAEFRISLLSKILHNSRPAESK